MNSIRFSTDRALAAAAAFILLLSAVWIIRNAHDFDRSFDELHVTPPPKSAAPSAKAAEVGHAADLLSHPPQWAPRGRSGLFVPEKHFIGPDGVPTTLQTTQVHPPVPNEWFEQFSLPIGDADLLTQDADGDGFTNFEEWQEHTNPTSKDSHPAYVTKLRMKSYERQPFKLVFSSWVGDTYALNTSDLREPTQFLKVGDAIRGTKFKIVDFAEKFETNKYGTRVDVSELTLQNGDTAEQVKLVKEQIMISPESIANFYYPVAEPHEFAVKKDQEFSLKPETQIKYKLVDVQPDKAVIVH